MTGGGLHPNAAWIMSGSAARGTQAELAEPRGERIDIIDSGRLSTRWARAHR